MSTDATGTAVQQALVETALKKAGLLWVHIPRSGHDDLRQAHALWYAWLHGTVYLLTGPGEQQDPGLSGTDSVRLLVPSKDTRQRLLAVDAGVSRLDPADPDWDEATSSLARRRLNLHQPTTASRRWQEPAYHLYRLRPSGEATRR